jgi:hypothetical protein
VLLGIRVSEAEAAACHKALHEWRTLEPKEPPIAARAHLIRALLNHNDFVTLR